ncbi:hypothetical protein RUM43_009303, partial [Polyplax serrata]
MLERLEKRGSDKADWTHSKESETNTDKQCTINKTTESSSTRIKQQYHHQQNTITNEATKITTKKTTTRCKNYYEKAYNIREQKDHNKHLQHASANNN